MAKDTHDLWERIKRLENTQKHSLTFSDSSLEARIRRTESLVEALVSDRVQELLNEVKEEQ